MPDSNNNKPNYLEAGMHAWLQAAHERILDLDAKPGVDHIGAVERIGDGVAMVTGLPKVRLEELLIFEGSVPGLAVALEEDSVACVLLGPSDEIAAGSRVVASGEVLKVPVCESLLGRVIDPLGRPLDGEPAPKVHRFEPAERPAPGIIDRELVTEPLLTGITVVDSMIPLGRGQRELIVGDRKTGKTAIAIDTIINQKGGDIISIYCAVGQNAASVNKVLDAVRRFGDPAQCIFVIAGADTAPGLQWLAPYAACTMAEFFMEQGKHALLITDDLTKHAAVHRQVSLLMRNPPGREAYPGDVFYIHSRLLERAAKLSDENGAGSLTALPIAETQAGNISAYIPTNLISITDGQIYLEPKLFNEGQKPAVNVGKSVSRVGGATQSAPMRQVAESLKLDYAQFLELEVFSRFGAMVDERTQRAINHGQRIRAILQQVQYKPLSQPHQVALILALSEGVLDRLEFDEVGEFKSRMSAWLQESTPMILDRIAQGTKLSREDKAALGAALRNLADVIVEDRKLTNGEIGESVD